MIHFQLPRPPTRAAVIRALIDGGHLRGEWDLEDHPEVAAEAQRSWHALAFQGCNFATQMSRWNEKYPEPNRRLVHGWDVLPITGVPMGSGPEEFLDRTELERALAPRLEDPSTHAVSILFPTVDDPRLLRPLLLTLGRHALWDLDDHAGDPSFSDLVHVGLRRRLTSGTLAYVLGFGPFDFLPPTRRAPFVELAFVAKRIEQPERDRLDRLRDVLPLKRNVDPADGHLAFMPFEVRDDEVFKLTWHSTKTMRTSRLEPTPQLDRGAKAKVTFALPPELWS